VSEHKDDAQVRGCFGSSEPANLRCVRTPKSPIVATRGTERCAGERLFRQQRAGNFRSATKRQESLDSREPHNSGAQLQSNFGSNAEASREREANTSHDDGHKPKLFE
jgi:hypothetical protein